MPDPNPVTDAERIAIMKPLYPDLFEEEPGPDALEVLHLAGWPADPLIDRACLLQRRVDELDKENYAIRQLLGLSDKPCVYCGEASMATCPNGFPGCGRADDVMLGPIPVEPCQEREDLVRGRLAHYQGELDRLMKEKAIIMGEEPHVAPPMPEDSQ